MHKRVHLHERHFARFHYAPEFKKAAIRIEWKSGRKLSGPTYLDRLSGEEALFFIGVRCKIRSALLLPRPIASRVNSRKILCPGSEMDH